MWRSRCGEGLVTNHSRGTRFAGAWSASWKSSTVLSSVRGALESSVAASSSGSLSRALWSTSRESCYSTSHYQTWTPSCVNGCGLKCAVIQQRAGFTAVYVTHDQEEALTLSDRIVVMAKGRIRQIGSPADVYESPVDGFVADFIGAANIILSRLESRTTTLSPQLSGRYG